MKLVNMLFVYVVYMSLSSAAAVSAENQQKSCIMGVFPFLSAQRMESVFAPLAADLSTVTDCKYRYQSTADFDEFMSQLKNQKYDIAFVQPFDYVQIAAAHGYIPLAARNESLHAVIVTQPKSNIRRLKDLQGKTVALPPSVAAVSYLTRVMLDHEGLKVPEDVDLLHTKNHGSCMHKVLIGKVDACATAPTTLRLFEVKNRHKLRIIARSPTIPSALFVVRSDISDENFLKLQQKLLDISPRNTTHKYLAKAGDRHVFRPVSDAEYGVVRDYCKKYRPILNKDNSYLCDGSKAGRTVLTDQDR